MADCAPWACCDGDRSSLPRPSRSSGRCPCHWLPGGEPPPEACPVDSDSEESPIVVSLDANGDATYEGCAHDDLESDWYLFTADVNGRFQITCEAVVGTIGGFLDSPSCNAGIECPFSEGTNVDTGQTALLEIWGGRPDSLGDDPDTLTYHWVPD